jgi:hypothetical protein
MQCFVFLFFCYIYLCIRTHCYIYARASRYYFSTFRHPLHPLVSLITYNFFFFFISFFVFCLFFVFFFCCPTAARSWLPIVTSPNNLLTLRANRTPPFPFNSFPFPINLQPQPLPYQQRRHTTILANPLRKLTLDTCGTNTMDTQVGQSLAFFSRHALLLPQPQYVAAM